MKILLVNDDGYKADGIKVLERVLSHYGHEVFVLAPTCEQSGKSHSMTLHGGCYATEYGPGHFHIDGTPADCIIYGLKSKLLGQEPDVVISGINHGYNLSTDIMYSGTCGAARQAAFYGYKAIAISTNKEKGEEFDFEGSAEFLAKHLDKFLASLKDRAFININIPPHFDGKYKYASIGEVSYDDKFSIEKQEDGRYLLTNIGCEFSYNTIEGKKHQNDFDLCRQGFAAVSFIEILPSCSSEHMDNL